MERSGSPGLRVRRLTLRKRLMLRVERIRLAARIDELRDLVDIPHDIGEVARMRIDRLDRRQRAIERLLRRGPSCRVGPQGPDAARKRASRRAAAGIAAPVTLG